jgi:hypothetical protein
MKKLFVFLLVEVLALSSGFFFSSLSFSKPLTLGDSPGYSKAAGQSVAALDLYTIHHGGLKKLTLDADQIGRGGISVDGYVCGLVLFCNAAATAKVDGKPMVRTSEENSLLGEGYSYFPDVKGNAISPNNEFRITVQSGSNVLDIPVQQKGYQTLAPPRFEKDLKYKIAFHYLGSEPNVFESGNFENRLRAVAQGIDAVQRTFGTSLVQNVNIIDYEAIQNAVMREGQSTVWFYTKVLRSEAAEELRVMAEHETLHLLVYKNGLTKNSQVRSLFADLKGFGTFSVERFLLLTKGVAASGRGEGMDREGMFFSFIDEKHFISGMHGGHSQENLDEFCTSFLHSLMYVDRFGNNLQSFLFPESDGGPSRLSPADRNFILHTYSRTIEIFSKALTPPSVSSSSSYSDATLLVLEKSLGEIRKEISSS